MVIRASQWQAMEVVSREQFIDRMVVHLKRYFPDPCKALGDVKLREVIVAQWAKANTYKFETEYGVCQYLNLVFSFGENFDQEPACAWARPHLEAENDPTEEARTDRLHEEALTHLK